MNEKTQILLGVLAVAGLTTYYFTKTTKVTQNNNHKSLSEQSIKYNNIEKYEAKIKPDIEPKFFSKIT